MLHPAVSSPALVVAAAVGPGVVGVGDGAVMEMEPILGGGGGVKGRRGAGVLWGPPGHPSAPPSTRAGGRGSGDAMAAVPQAVALVRLGGSL